jgi:hypothetical protein
MRHSVDQMKNLLPVAVKVCIDLEFFLFELFPFYNRFESLFMASTTRTSNNGIFRPYTYCKLCFMASNITITVCISLGWCNCSNLVNTRTSNENWFVDTFYLIKFWFFFCYYLESLSSNESSSWYDLFIYIVYISLHFNIKNYSYS